MNRPSTEQAIEQVTRQGDASDPPQTPEQSPKPKRGLKRWVVRLFVLGVLLVAGLIGLAPTLLSTGPGTSLVLSIINGQGEAKLQIESLSLSWGKGQSITGLSYADPDQGINASVRQIDAPDVSLLGLIRGERKLGDITLSDTDVVVQQTDRADDTGDTNEDEKEDRQDEQPFALPPGLSGSVTLNNLRVEYQPTEQDPAVLILPTGSVKMPDLRDISFDVNASLQQGLRQGTVRLKGNVLNLFDPDGKAQQFAADYDLDSEVAGLSTAVLDSIVSGLDVGVEPGLVTAVLGDGDLSASAKANGTIEQLASELHAQSPNGQLHLYQELDGDTLIASPKSSASLKLTTDAFAKLFKDSALSLARDGMITMTSLEMRLPTTGDGFDLDAASMGLRVGADNTLELKDESGEVIAIDALQVRGGAASIAEKLTFEVSATVAAKDKEGRYAREPVKAELVVNKPLVAEREIVFFSDALPIQLADALSGQDGKLVMWLGEMLALRVDLRGRFLTDEQGEGRLVRSFSLLPEGRINGEVVGAIDAGKYTVSTKDKAPIQAVLVPEAFASLMEMLSREPGKPMLTIDKPLAVLVTLRDAERGEVSIVTDPSRESDNRFFIDPDRTYAGATIELPATRVYDPARQTSYELRSGRLSLSAPDLRGKVQIKADMKFWTRPDAGSQGVPALLTWQTKVQDILDTEGAVPMDPAVLMKQIALDGGLGLKNIPSDFFDSLLKRNGDIASILGPIVNDLEAGFTYSDGRPTGAEVRLNWDEKTNQPIAGAWASMTPAQFDLDANRMLTVRGGKDIDLTVKVTEAFGDRWMGKLHPILFDAKSGDRPIKIRIDGKSFRFPLNDPTMKGARVNATIDLGSVTFGNDALLGKIMDWTGRPGERAVFDPAEVSLVDGRIKYDKFGMTVGNVQVRLDGEVDLASKQIVNMAVRVPGKSLTKVFNELEGLIAPDDFLSIPMSGSIRSPKFDKELFMSELAELAKRGLKQKIRDTLFDKLREELGLPDNGPADNPGQDAPDQPPAEQEKLDEKPEDTPEEEPEQAPRPVEDEIRDELIERGLDLIFGGGRRDRQEDEGGE